MAAKLAVALPLLAIIASTSAIVNLDFAFVDDVVLRSCNCVHVYQCPAIINLLPQALNNDILKEYLNAQHMRCGWIGKYPKVCCPNTASDFLKSLAKYLESSKERSMLLVPSVPKQSGMVGINQLVSPSSKGQVGIARPSVQVNAQAGMNVNVNSNKNKVSAQLSKHVELNTECGKVPSTPRTGSIVPTDITWLALLEYETPKGNRFLCGGTLVTDQVVLTAARCVTSLANKLISVRLGEYDLNSPIKCAQNATDFKYKCAKSSVNVAVDSVHIHESYNAGVEHRLVGLAANSLQNDVALVRLKQRVEFSDSLQPACLPMRSPQPEMFYSAGWSRSMIPATSGNSRKKLAVVKDLGSRACAQHSFFSNEEHVCVGTGSNSVGDGVCVGDAGGPLMAYETKRDGARRLTLYGLSAADMSCERAATNVGVYTKIYEFVPWINKKLQEIERV